MACHELGALRLGLMKIIGIENEAARIHDENEVGEALNNAGPIQSLAKADSLKDLQKFFDSSISDLEERVSKLSDDDKNLPYYRSLLILTKKVELELESHLKGVESFWKNLDEMHDYVHEIFPG
ncbi:DUF3209 family protein [Bacteriovoracales bacterium]|nr:DUF3209 family protein [Bacteriovoracales bacterium]